MGRHVRRGPGPSSTLITTDHAGNVVGVDPHKRTLTATVVDPRAGIVASEHFRVSGDGHRALEAWARQFGPIVRWGIEGASSWDRHTAIFLIRRGYDVRDVCPNRTGRHDRARQRGKSDTLDSERIARETLAHPLLPRAFKRAGDQVGPDEQTELLTVWWQARFAMIKRRQQLLSESEALLRDLPLELIERLPDATAVRPRLAALARVTRRRRFTPPTALRITFLGRYRAEVARLDAEEKALTHRLAELVHHSGSTLDELCGLSTVSVAELLVEVGDVRRFTEGGLRASTGPRRWPRRPPRGLANRSAIVTILAATGGSTRSSTGWRSPSCAASRAPGASTPTRVPRVTPRGRPVASSSDTSPTLSTGVWSATGPRTPPRPSSVQNPARTPRSQGWPDRAERSEPRSGIP